MRLAFTRRTDYAVRAAHELAVRSPALGTHLDVAGATGAPPTVMKQALADLARAGLAVAVRGRSGGYRLARDPGEISMLELVTALERLGDDAPRCVLRSGVCNASAPCPFHDTIAAAREAFAEALARDSLADVLARAGRGAS